MVRGANLRTVTDNKITMNTVEPRNDNRKRTTPNVMPKC